jgi:hypothetical protein
MVICYLRMYTVTFQDEVLEKLQLKILDAEKLSIRVCHWRDSR